MPENNNKIFSVAMAAILTLVIVVVWFSFSKDSANDQVAVEKSNKLSSLSPWQVIKEEFSKAFSGLSEEFEAVSSSTIPIEIIVATSTDNTEVSTTSDNIN